MTSRFESRLKKIAEKNAVELSEVLDAYEDFRQTRVEIGLGDERNLRFFCDCYCYEF